MNLETVATGVSFLASSRCNRFQEDAGCRHNRAPSTGMNRTHSCSSGHRHNTSHPVKDMSVHPPFVLAQNIFLEWYTFRHSLQRPEANCCTEHYGDACLNATHSDRPGLFHSYGLFKQRCQPDADGSLLTIAAVTSRH